MAVEDPGEPVGLAPRLLDQVRVGRHLGRDGGAEPLHNHGSGLFMAVMGPPVGCLHPLLTRYPRVQARSEGQAPPRIHTWLSVPSPST
jgi:hypothetical protein